MGRFVLITVGSRGDAEPFISLADQLLQSDENHSIDIFLQLDHQTMTTKESLRLAAQANAGDGEGRLRIHTLPFTMMDFYKYSTVPPTHGATHENPRVKFIGIVTDIIAALVFPCWKSLLNVVEGNEGGGEPCSAIITSALARPLALAVAQKVGSTNGTVEFVPTCIIHLQPLVPTQLFPHYSHVDDCISVLVSDLPLEPNESYEETYLELEQYQYDFLKERLQTVVINEMNTDTNGSSDTFTLTDFNTDLKSILKGSHENVYIINAFDTSILIPKVATSNVRANIIQNIFEMGPLADAYIPRTFQVSLQSSSPVVVTTIQTFIETCQEEDDELPICIGYGSMPYTSVDIIFQALKECNRKAILVGSIFVDDTTDTATTAIGTSKLPKEDLEWIQSNTIGVVDIPYPWLLPQCSMMLCHGGAGVVHACLRAGIPPVISPLMGDQFTWAKLVEAKGIGISTKTNLMSQTVQDLVSAIDAATKCYEMTQQIAVQFKEEGDDETGVSRMVDWMDVNL